MPPEDERELRIARGQQHEAAQARASLEQERATTSAELDRVHEELEQLDAPQREAMQRYREDKLAFDRYAQTIAAARSFADTCDEQPGPFTAAETGSSHAEYLGRFVAEPERDAALDGCRERLAKQAREQVKEHIEDLRAEFAIEVEDIFGIGVSVPVVVTGCCCWSAAG